MTLSGQVMPAPVTLLNSSRRKMNTLGATRAWFQLVTRCAPTRRLVGELVEASVNAQLSKTQDTAAAEAAADCRL